MKLIALSVLLTVFAYSNCEPVEYSEKPRPNTPWQEQKKEKARENRSVAKKGDEINARVVGISDGDSIVVLVNGNQRERVRLATIDAPENHQAFGKPSKQSLSDLIYNKDIRIVTVNKDKYGRIVGEVFIGDTNVNLEQIRRGYAWHYKAHARQQTKEKRKDYETAENEARLKKLGIWNDTNPTPPWDYRNKKKDKEK